jgi:cell division protein FtsQ
MSSETAPRRRSRGGIAALALIGVAAGAWAVAASPLFHIRDVQVRGTRHLSAPEVVRLARIGSRANLLTLPAERVERALARNPWIRSVSAHRSLPSTLILTIEERVPVAWVRLPKGIAVVAADGMVLSRRRNAPEGLVGIGSSGRALAPGDTLGGREAPLAVAASLPAALRPVVESASLKKGELILRLESGTRVRYGATGSLSDKNATLANVLGWAGLQGAELAYVDLRVAGNPAVRVRGT